MKKRLALITAAVCVQAALLAGCGSEINKDNDVPKPEGAVTTAVTTTDDSSKENKNPSEIKETQITPNKVKFTKFSKEIEAESCTLSGKAKSAKSRKGFSGKGYVSGINSQDDFTAKVTVPASQYYNITITAAADKQTKCGFAVNGDRYSEITVGNEKTVKTNTGKFVKFSFNGIYLEKGEVTFSIIPQNGISPDIDKISVTASSEASAMNLTVKNPALSNKNSDKNTQTLYKYICDNYGKKVILAQHDSVGTSNETDLIYKTTGKYPAIRFGDMKMFTEADYTEDNEIPSALKWAGDNGIVGYMWHWTAPSGGASCYADSTKFDLSKAVTKENISQKPVDELEAMAKSGKISAECVALVKDIDTISKQLAILRDNGVAVIWRPLHEASNGTFWWGKDADSYKWLWKLMYERQTKYHKLTNLIWVWSAQNVNWYVGDNYCDILSADIYDDGNKSGQISSLMLLNSICKTKPAAISECGNFPSIQSIADEGAYWSFIGQWGSDYLMNEDGTLNESHNTADELALMYNNNLVITREDLPDFTGKAKKENDKKDDSSQGTKTAQTTTAKETKKTEQTKQNAQTSDKSQG